MIETRIAGLPDRDAAIAVLDAIHRHYFAKDRSSEALETSVSDFIDKGHMQMLLAFEGTTPVGCATYTFLQPSPNGYGVLFMKDLFVMPGSRGKNIGQRLMADLTKIAHDRGCSRVDWTAEMDNPGARRFYDRLGANVVQEKVYYRVRDTEMAAFIASCSD